MVSKLLLTTKPSAKYLYGKGEATDSQYERITTDTARQVDTGYRTLAAKQEELREQVGALSKADSNSVESLTKEVLGRAISILVNGNTANMVDPIGALIVRINRALYAVNNLDNLSKKQLQNNKILEKQLILQNI